MPIAFAAEYRAARLQWLECRVLVAENEVVPSFAQQPLRWMDFAVLILEK